jgi:hypothetical protein
LLQANNLTVEGIQPSLVIISWGGGISDPGMLVKLAMHFMTNTYTHILYIYIALEMYSCPSNK